MESGHEEEHVALAGEIKQKSEERHKMVEKEMKEKIQEAKMMILKVNNIVTQRL